MKKKSTILLLIGIILIIASYFVMKHEVETELNQDTEEDHEEEEEEPELKPRKPKKENVVPAQIIEPKPIIPGANEKPGE